MTLYKLDANYKSFFGLVKSGDEDARPPKFLPRGYFCVLCYNQSGYKIVDNKISFSHKHPSKTELSFDLKYVSKFVGKIKQVEIFCDRKKRYFVSINHEIEVPKYADNGQYQALDLGINSIVTGVNLHSKFIQVKNRRADLYWKSKVAEVQSRRDHCLKGSHRWHWYNAKFWKMKRKCSNQLKDFQHFTSKKIITNTKANTLIVGDLDVKKMVRKKKGTGSARKTKAQKTLNHSIQNTGSMGRFVEFLSYKAELVGKRVVRIDESYTTQDCCICSKRVKRALHERIVHCDCGNTLDRDKNSAVNIMKRFINNKVEFDFLSHQSSVNEVSFLKQWNGIPRQTGTVILENNGVLAESPVL